MKVYQAKLNGDQFTFTEVCEISDEIIYWWKALPTFETKAGLVKVYYEKGASLNLIDELYLQCQQYFE